MSNTITITGRLARDPELKFASTGTAMCKVSIPDQKRVKNQQTGEWEDASATTWFNVTVFKEAAEALAEKGRKGDEVVVTGRLITREWEGRDGQKQSSLEIDYATVALVPRHSQAQRGTGGQQPQQGSDPWAAPAPSGGQGGWGGSASDTEPPF